MNILYMMIPITLFLSLGFIAAFIWATSTGQWDDLDLTPKRLLNDQQNKKDEDAKE